jgi:excisionase family DNA binding protein
VSTEATVRLALRREEAARALGISDESFDRYIRAELPVVRVGTLRLYPVDAVTEWLRDRQSAPIQDVGGR